MELGNIIKKLRFKANMTQEQLADNLKISPQSVSKWENNISMPDVSLLPKLAEIFGVSIDELFGLSDAEKIKRIGRRLDFEEELPPDVFREYEDYLKSSLEKIEAKGEILSLLAHLYHHRMLSDARKVSKYAMNAMCLAPERKDCQWLLNKAEGQYIWDWNAGNHAKIIDFYKELIRNDDHETPTFLPHFYLLDNLIADNRTEEAKVVLQEFARIQKDRDFMVDIYSAHIALKEYKEAEADTIIEVALEKFGDSSDLLFEVAQYYARKADYDTAIKYYELSYEKHKKPRFIDALQGIAIIYEIKGDYAKAAETVERILENLRTEWNMTEEISVVEAEREKERLLKKFQK